MLAQLPTRPGETEILRIFYFAKFRRATPEEIATYIAWRIEGSLPAINTIDTVDTFIHDHVLDVYGDELRPATKEEVAEYVARRINGFN